MKNLKKFAFGCLVAMALTTTSITASAAPSYSSPAKAVADITGQSLEKVTAQWEDGKSYGMIADEAGKLEEFHEALLDMKKDGLNSLVKKGSITQKQADATLKALEDRQTLCDGTGICAGSGCGYGRAQGNGQGRGYGQGRGNGMRNGCCQY